MNEVIERGMMTDSCEIRQFILAGNSTFTVRSKKTGCRFTFKVKRTKGEPSQGWTNNPSWFVLGLTGPNNETDFRYLGLLRGPAVRSGRMDWFPDRHNRVDPSAPIQRAWQWVMAGMVRADTFNSDKFLHRTEFWHEGRCGRCGRKLTDPESIARGIGPDCSGKL